MPPKMESDPPSPKATRNDPPSSGAERTRTYRQRRRLRLRSVRIQLSDAEIGALVRLGYLGSPDNIGRSDTLRRRSFPMRYLARSDGTGSVEGQVMPPDRPDITMRTRGGNAFQ